jgi:hypothetical protein
MWHACCWLERAARSIRVPRLGEATSAVPIRVDIERAFIIAISTAAKVGRPGREPGCLSD